MDAPLMTAGMIALVTMTGGWLFYAISESQDRATRRQWIGRGRCGDCGYRMQFLPTVRCPECGNEDADAWRAAHS
jgi:uncharacterized OB-fold protein